MWDMKNAKGQGKFFDRINTIYGNSEAGVGVMSRRGRFALS